MSLIHWIYLPKPKSHLKRFRVLRSRNPGGSRLFQRRKYNLHEHDRLFKIIVGLFMLVFAVRIGSVVAFTLHHPLGFSAAMYADGVHLPKAESGRAFYGHRFMLLISITEDGLVEFDGEQVAPENWGEYLMEYRYSEPRMQILFLVDRNCTMESVQEVLAALKANGVREIVFATSDRDDTFL